MFFRPAALTLGAMVLAGTPAFSGDPDSRILGNWRKEGSGDQLEIRFQQGDLDTRRLYNGKFVFQFPKGPIWGGKMDEGKFYTCEVAGADMCIEAGAMNCSVHIRFDGSKGGEGFKLFLRSSAIRSGQYCNDLTGTYLLESE